MEKRYLNTQKYSECQLVTAINAASHFGEPLVLPDSPEYERLVDYMEGAKEKGIYESSIRQAYKYLRIGYYRISSDINSIKRALDLGHPVEVNYYHKPYMHSALIVDYTNSKVKIPNSCIGSASGWIKWKDLYRYIAIGKRKARKLGYHGINFGKLKAFFVREPRIVFEAED